MVVLIGLAVVWTLVLAPDILRLIRRGDSGQRGRSGLSLGALVPRRRTPTAAYRSSPRPTGGLRGPSFTGFQTSNMNRPGTPRSSTLSEAQRRRATVLFVLAILAVLSLIAAFVAGGSFIGIHLMVDVLLAGYVYILTTQARYAREQTARMRSHPGYGNRQGRTPRDRYAPGSDFGQAGLSYAAAGPTLHGTRRAAPGRGDYRVGDHEPVYDIRQAPSRRGGHRSNRTPIPPAEDYGYGTDEWGEDAQGWYEPQRRSAGW